MERLRRYYLEQGYPGDVFEAVLARHPTRPFDFHRRLQAVTGFAREPAAASLAAANKRIRNILRQNTEPVPEDIDRQALEQDAERGLVAELEKTRETVRPLLADREYGPVLAELTGLRDSVDRFFDQVMVMSEDPRARANRLAILQQLRELFLTTADISCLQSESWN